MLLRFNDSIRIRDDASCPTMQRSSDFGLEEKAFKSEVRSLPQSKQQGDVCIDASLVMLTHTSQERGDCSRPGLCFAIPLCEGLSTLRAQAIPVAVEQGLNSHGQKIPPLGKPK